MRLSEYDLETRQGGVKLPSPEVCIYCGTATNQLTDEHIIPYALGANAAILRKSCCTECQATIQHYEQDVLKRQIGFFRAQVDAPTRNKKARPTTQRFHFAEVDEDGRAIRDLGYRTLPIEECPIVFNLWQSPPARLFRTDESPVDVGRPWTHFDKEAISELCRRVAEETGAVNVAVELGKVNRVNYLRSLAKTAHAYAAATVGVDAFEPVLADLILKRSDDVEQYVGDASVDSPFVSNPTNTLQISLGEAQDGPAQGFLFVFIRLYPALNSPSHMVVVGKARVDIAARINRLAEDGHI